jgi:hypothetical protein
MPRGSLDFVFPSFLHLKEARHEKSHNKNPSGSRSSRGVLAGARKMKHEWAAVHGNGHHGHGVSMKARTAGWCVSRFFRQPVDHSLNAVLGIVRQDGKFKERGGKIY